MRAAEALKDHAPELGVLLSPSATLEELYLARRIPRALSSHNINHRLRQLDFLDQAADPPYPALGMPLAAVDGLKALFIIGSNLRREAPLLAHRVRKAALRGAAVAMLNPVRFPYQFPVKTYIAAAPADLVADLAAVLAAAAAATGKGVPEELA